MEESLSIAQFICIIEQLPADEPEINPRIWYTTQKQHWLGWLGEYDGPGAYGRKTDKQRDARYAYNHIVEAKMLLWLIRAAGATPEQVAAIQQAAVDGHATLQQQSAAIRKVVPWEEVMRTLRDQGHFATAKARWVRRLLS